MISLDFWEDLLVDLYFFFSAEGRGEDLDSFLMLGFLEPLVAALCLLEGMLVAMSTGVSLSIFKPPRGSSAAAFSAFLGCFFAYSSPLCCAVTLCRRLLPPTPTF